MRMMQRACRGWNRLYPFRSHYLPLDGLRYHYVDEGSGPAVLFVHGNPTWSFLWRGLICGLRREFRTIAVDHIGCGLSDKPVDYPYTLHVHAQNLAHLVQSLDLDDVALVGHDWGGPIGLAAAMACPRRFSRFVLMNTGAFPPPYLPLRIRVCQMPLVGRWLVQRWNAFLRAAFWMAVHDRKCLTADARSGFLVPYSDVRHRVAIHRFVQDIPTTPRHPTWQVLEWMENALPTLGDRPWQFIWGMRDWCFRPECLDRLLESLPHARVHRIENAGHWVMEDAPGEVLKIVEQFLSET